MADKKISALTGAATPLAGTEVLPIVQSGATVKVSAANITAGRAVSVASLNAVGSGAGGTQTLATFNAAADAFSNSVELALEPLISGQSRTGIGAQREGVGTGAAVYLTAGGNEVLRGTVAGNISVATGNLVIGTAGKGIDFSANTHAAGMTSELLNWYEEGNWTPTFYGWTGTYATQIGKYTRIGRQVFLEAVIVTNGGTGTFSQTFPNVQGVPIAIQYLGAGAAYGQWFGVSGFSVGATNTSSGTFDYGSASEFFCNITGINTAGVGNLTNTMLSNSSNVAMRIIATYIA